MNSWLSDNTSSTSSTYNSGFYYTSRSPIIKMHVKKSDSQRPLAHLRETEVQLKEEKDKPSVSMPTEPILFDPKDLVL